MGLPWGLGAAGSSATCSGKAVAGAAAPWAKPQVTTQAGGNGLMTQKNWGVGRRAGMGMALLGAWLGAQGAQAAESYGPYARDPDGTLVRQTADDCWRSDDPSMAPWCGKAPDGDGDGVGDDLDRCPTTPRGVPVDAHGCPPDADRDGVPDGRDRCPDTPYGVRVDTQGCPLDLDGDGVPYYLDRCPTTPRGSEVDERGCARKLVMRDVLFAFDRARLLSAGRVLLDQLAASLGGRPDVRGLRVTGHTDSVGPRAYNQRLSEIRARVVADYLHAHGITVPISASGRGELQPVASNATRAGRERNRRVEIEVLDQGE
jgi:OmpA-OmpF porin, OOP family